MSDTALKASTQEHLDIYSVKDDLVILKDGAVALILQSSAINFGLLSEAEQDATIFAYAGLLNSLSFPVQIIIRSTRKDITSYIETLDIQMEKTRSQKIKEQIVKYRSYIKGLVKENKVMEKRIYLVIPYTNVELGLTVKNFNPLAKAPQKPAYELSYILDKAKINLGPRRDHLIRQLARLGLSAHQLSTNEIITLFFRVYNPDVSASFQNLSLDDLQKVVVESRLTHPPQPPQSSTPIPPAPQTPPSPVAMSTPSAPQMPTSSSTPPPPQPLEIPKLASIPQAPPPPAFQPPTPPQA